MRKIIPGLIAVVLVVGVIAFLGIGTFRFMDSKTEASNLGQYSKYFKKTTYHFTGKSKHFKFNIGRALLNSDNKVILISDIEQTKPIDFLKKETLIIKIRGEEYKKIDNLRNLNSLNSNIRLLEFFEEQKRCGDDTDDCENPEIEFPNAAHFKKNFEVGIEYCTNEGQCNYEKFKLNYGLF